MAKGGKKNKRSHARERRREMSEEAQAEAPEVGGEGARPSRPNPEVLENATRRQFTAAYKLGIIEAANACKEPGEIGALLRREGLYTSHLAAWRRAQRRGVLRALSPSRRGPKPSAPNPLQPTVARLEKENKRLQGRLRRAECIIEVQKKLSEILSIELPSHPSDENDS